MQQKQMACWPRILHHRAELVCEHLCMGVCVFLCARVCMCVGVYTRTCVCVFACLFVRAHVCLCMGKHCLIFVSLTDMLTEYMKRLKIKVKLHCFKTQPEPLSCYVPLYQIVLSSIRTYSVNSVPAFHEYSYYVLAVNVDSLVKQAAHNVFMT